MTRWPTLALAIALTLAWAGASAAEQGPQPAAESKPKPTSMSDLLKDLEQKQGAQLGGLLTSDCASLKDETTSARCWHAYREYLDYYQSGFAHRRTVFWWQHVSSRIIFAVVLGLVAVGVFFAWIQFRRDLVRPAASAGAEPVVTQLEIGQTGVRVSSPVLGVIILVISLAFFYLYLVYVYPIKEIV